MTIRRITRANRRGLVSHFLALDAEDRRLRFGNPISDEAVRAYVAQLDFGRDGLFAYADARRRIVGVAHVAVAATDAEIGLSVLPCGRGLNRVALWFAFRVAASSPQVSRKFSSSFPQVPTTPPSSRRITRVAERGRPPSGQVEVAPSPGC